MKEPPVRPHHLSIFHAQGEDGIAGVGGEASEAVARPDVDELAFSVDGRRVPYGSAGGTEDFLPVRVFAELAQRLWNALNTPQHLARIGVE
jgi:hypothetical protein